MECPNCDNRLDFVAPVFENVGVYAASAVGLTLCCNTMVKIYRVVKFSAVASDSREDNWGHKL